MDRGNAGHEPAQRLKHRSSRKFASATKPLGESLPIVAIQGLAFGFGLGTVALVYLVATAVRGHEPALVLVLAGVVLGALAGACLSLVKILADPYDQLPAITFWLLGSLAVISATPRVPMGEEPS